MSSSQNDSLENELLHLNNALNMSRRLTVSENHFQPKHNFNHINHDNYISDNSMVRSLSYSETIPKLNKNIINEEDDKENNDMMAISLEEINQIYRKKEIKFVEKGINFFVSSTSSSSIPTISINENNKSLLNIPPESFDRDLLSPSNNKIKSSKSSMYRSNKSNLLSLQNISPLNKISAIKFKSNNKVKYFSDININKLNINCDIVNHINKDENNNIRKINVPTIDNFESIFMNSDDEMEERDDEEDQEELNIIESKKETYDSITPKNHKSLRKCLTNVFLEQKTNNFKNDNDLTHWSTINNTPSKTPFNKLKNNYYLPSPITPNYYSNNKTSKNAK